MVVNRWQIKYSRRRRCSILSSESDALDFACFAGKINNIQCYNIVNIDCTIIIIMIYSPLWSTSKRMFQLDFSVMVAGHREKRRPSQRKWPKVAAELQQFRLSKLDRLKCIYQTTGLTSLSSLITSMSRYTRLLRNDERFKTTVRVNTVDRDGKSSLKSVSLLWHNWSISLL